MKLSFLSYELMELRSVKEINRSHATDYLSLDKSPHKRKPRTKYESAFQEWRKNKNPRPTTKPCNERREIFHQRGI